VSANFFLNILSVIIRVGPAAEKPCAKTGPWLLFNLSADYADYRRLF